MMKKKYVEHLIKFLIICFGTNVYCQSTLKITGSFQPIIEMTELSVYKPVDGYFNIFNPDTKGATFIENGRFKTELTLERPGFVRLQSKGMPKTYFYAEPGDNIQLSFVTDENGATKTIYTGENAAVNNLISKKKLLNNGLESQELIIAVLKTSETSEQALEKLEYEIRMVVKPIEALYLKKNISKTCYENIVSQIEQRMLSWINNFVISYFGNDKKIVQQVKMKRKEMKMLTASLYDRYDPFHKRNISATSNYSNSHTKSKLLQNKNITSKKSVNKTWAAYDNIFGMVVSQLAAIDYAPDEIQMKFLGNSLLTASIFKPMSNSDFLNIFNLYSKKFPESPYLGILSSKVDSLGETNLEKGTVHNFAVYQFGDTNADFTEKPLKGSEEIKTFQSLVKKHFDGSFVFVDFWATWCSPCIAEFRNESKLHSFLKKNNIKMLYVSINKKEASENWKKLVLQYKLSGYHYLANATVVENLHKWFQGIPRYMLFAPDGTVLNDNLPRPSKKDELFDQISELIDK